MLKNRIMLSLEILSTMILWVLIIEKKMVWKFKLFPVGNNVDITAGKYVACLIYQPYSSFIEIKKRRANLSFSYIFKV